MAAGPELSSISSDLEGLTKRIAAMAESFSGTERDDLASALFDVERGLIGSRRRLEQVVNALL
ncbi:MAG TPA: hypothetical protein VM262_07975 [Acidimicrobiales bacterium]|nr:hypothetical protein [Acidimicrobiales bacterium]